MGPGPGLSPPLERLQPLLHGGAPGSAYADDEGEDGHRDRSSDDDQQRVHGLSSPGRHEYGLRELDAGEREPVREGRPQAGGRHVAEDPSFRVHAYLLELEEVLHGHDLTFHAGDLGDVSDPPDAVAEAGELHYQVQG